MFKKILVPLDGSLFAEAALAPAAFIALRMHSSVKLIHVIEKNAPETVHEQTHLTTTEQAETYLNKISISAFDSSVFIERHVHRTEVENVAKSIVEHAREFSIDIIIMCTHGSGSAKSWLWGTIAQQIIAMGSIPVLIVHPSLQQAEKSFMCKKILVPLDGKQQHDVVFPYVREFVGICGSTIDLVTAIPTLKSISGPWTKVSRLLPGTTSHLLEIEETDALEYLREKCAQLAQEGILGKISVVRGDPARQIAKTADAINADIIILSTHKKIGFSAFWEGSVAPGICQESRIPMLLIPLGE